MQKHYTTKEFAELVGRKVGTIYHWESKGVLKADKDFKGRNIYTDKHLKQVLGENFKDYLSI